MEFEIAEATKSNARKWINRKTTWEAFMEHFRHPIVKEGITAAQYHQMETSERSAVKNGKGFVGGRTIDGKRSAQSFPTRQILVLDADYVEPKDPLFLKLERFALSKAVIHSTLSSTPEAPRLRIIIPLSRPCDSGEYRHIAESVMDELGRAKFDETAIQMNRLMYYPATFADQLEQYYLREIEGEPLSVEQFLTRYPVPAGEPKRNTKLENPLDKGGWIGAFCRVYNIHQAIEKYLHDIYLPTDDANRYTYHLSSTVGGLVVYDDLYAFSHHDSDPLSQKEVNAFDMVRVQLFGALDVEVEGKKITDLPSQRAMVDLCTADATVTSMMTRLEFGDLEDDDTPTKDIPFKRSERGRIKDTIRNVLVVFEHCNELKGLLRFNLFKRQIEKTRIPPWDSTDVQWTDQDDSQLRTFLDATYDFQVSASRLADGVLATAKQQSYHPVKEYIESVEWDGVQRMERFFIDYLGVDDNLYTREVTRKWFIGAVARIYSPGIKFENVPVLEGEQGIGKSTAIKMLAPAFFSDGLDGLGQSKDDHQFLIGTWILELGELSALKRTETEKVKKFISTTVDRFRPSHGRHVTEFPRTCVFIGSSNVSGYLKDKTGNRRFNPLICHKSQQVKSPFDDRLNDEALQLWAEARHYYLRNEPLYLSAAAEAIAQEKRRDTEVEDPMQEMIYEFLDIPIPTDWEKRPVYDRQAFIRQARGEEERLGTEVECVQRTKVTLSEIFVELLGRSSTYVSEYRSASEIKKVSLILQNHPEWEKTRYRVPGKRNAIFGYRRKPSGIDIDDLL